MTTESSASSAATDQPAAATPVSVNAGTAADTVGTEQDAQRREEQWRIPQLLTALVTPILGFIAVIFNMMGSNTYANITGALAITTGAAAALMAVEMWRLHRVAAGQP